MNKLHSLFNYDLNTYYHMTDKNIGAASWKSIILISWLVRNLNFLITLCEYWSISCDYYYTDRVVEFATLYNGNG
jgi:hypothetical protein